MVEPVTVYDCNYFGRNFISADFEEEEEPIQKLPAFRDGKIQREQILVARRKCDILRIIEGVFTKLRYFNTQEAQTTLEAKIIGGEQIKMILKLDEIGQATLITIKKIEGKAVVFDETFLALSEALAVQLE